MLLSYCNLRRTIPVKENTRHAERAKNGRRWAWLLFACMTICYILSPNLRAAAVFRKSIWSAIPKLWPLNLRGTPQPPATLPRPRTPGLIEVLRDGSESVRAVDCDVPCQWSDRGPNVTLNVTIRALRPPNSVVVSMEGELKYNQLALSPENTRWHGGMSTTSFESDIPLPYFSWAEYKLQRAHVDFAEVRKIAVFIANNCESLSKRENLVRELEALMPVHSVSGCLHNKNVPPVEKANKTALMRQYALYLAFENQRVDDYITEKLWGALAAGVLPVYFGAPNVLQHVPDGAIVNAAAFPNMGALAAHLNEILRNKTLYDSYHAWRYEPLPPWFTKKYNFTHIHSECRTCRWAHAQLHHDMLWDRANQVAAPPEKGCRAVAGIERRADGRSFKLFPLDCLSMAAANPKHETVRITTRAGPEGAATVDVLFRNHSFIFGRQLSDGPVFLGASPKTVQWVAVHGAEAAVLEVGCGTNRKAVHAHTHTRGGGGALLATLSPLPRRHLFFFAGTSSTQGITLCTQLTVDRLPRLTFLAGRWRGPVSAVVYVGMRGAVAAELSLLKRARNASTALQKYVNIHVVYAPSRLERAFWGRKGQEKPGNVPYPTNLLRQIGVEAARTRWVFYLDVDMATPVHGHRLALASCCSGNKWSKSRTLYVVPVYHGDSVPASKSELIGALAEPLRVRMERRSGEALHYDAFERDISLSTKTMFLRHSDEPYYIVRKLDLPKFDVLSSGRISQVRGMRMLSYRRMSHETLFVVRLPSSVESDMKAGTRIAAASQQFADEVLPWTVRRTCTNGPPLPAKPNRAPPPTKTICHDSLYGMNMTLLQPGVESDDGVVRLFTFPYAREDDRVRVRFDCPHGGCQLDVLLRDHRALFNYTFYGTIELPWQTSELQWAALRGARGYLSQSCAEAPVLSPAIAMPRITRFRPASHFFSDGVTLCTSLSLEQLPHLIRLATQWQGPVSAVLYVGLPSPLPDWEAEHRINTSWASSAVLRRFVSLRLVHVPAAWVESGARDLGYPGHRLRRVSIEHARTPWVLYADVEIQTPNLGYSKATESCCDAYDALWVVPLYYRVQPVNTPVPNSTASLAPTLLTRDVLHASDVCPFFFEDFESGHADTDVKGNDLGGVPVGEGRQACMKKDECRGFVVFGGVAYLKSRTTANVRVAQKLAVLYVVRSSNSTHEPPPLTQRGHASYFISHRGHLPSADVRYRDAFLRDSNFRYLASDRAKAKLHPTLFLIESLGDGARAHHQESLRCRRTLGTALAFPLSHVILYNLTSSCDTHETVHVNAPKGTIMDVLLRDHQGVFNYSLRGPLELPWTSSQIQWVALHDVRSSVFLSCGWCPKPMAKLPATLARPNRTFLARRAAKSFSTGVTLCTQLTVERLPRLIAMAQRWQGPVSAVVYLGFRSIAASEETILNKAWETNVVLHDFVNLHLVYAPYGFPTGETTEGHGLNPYPVNLLRQVSIEQAQTPWVLVVEADMATPRHGYDVASAACCDSSSSGRLWVVPLYHGPWVPKSKKGLLGALAKGEIVRESALYGSHASTPYEAFEDERAVPDFHIQEGQEPYYIARRDHLPPYDVLYMGMLADKVSQLAAMSSYTAKLHPSLFLVDVPSPGLGDSWIAASPSWRQEFVKQTHRWTVVNSEQCANVSTRTSVPPKHGLS